MRRANIGIVLGATALIVALLGSTPIGEAAQNAVPAFAKNAEKVDGIHASKQPKAGFLLPLGKDKKLPASVVPVGATGPAGSPGVAGPVGPAGPQGAPGLSGLEVIVDGSEMNSNTLKYASVGCPSGKRAIGGGAATNPGFTTNVLTDSHPKNTPQGPTGWEASARETVAYAGFWQVKAYVICATLAQ